MTPPVVGIMQGRLSPPSGGTIQCFPADTWEAEFARAQAAGLACIEWIYEEPNADRNPLGTPAGIRRMKALAASTGVNVWSICADWFMTQPLVRDDAPNPASIAKLKWLLGQARELGATYVILPFVDNSSLRTPAAMHSASELLRAIGTDITAAGVEVHLETDLPPEVFRTLLARIDHAMVRANYDSGNSSSLGYDPAEELATLAPWLGSVHIKDRVRGGGTVPLGTGSADLPTCFRMFREVGFARWFVLQVARGEPGDEVNWARQNREYVQRLHANAAATAGSR